jgi:hypothetical protein
MLPMAKAMLDAVKGLAIPELVRVPVSPPKIPIDTTRQLHGRSRRQASR